MNGGIEDGDLDIQAAEYVIGTLDRDERAAFTERLEREDGVRRSVAAWERRLAGLIGHVSPVLPPPELWARIERALGAPSSRAVPFTVIEGGGRQSEAPDLRRSRDRWRFGALLSGALAAALLIALLGGTPRPAADTTYVAAVNRGGDKPALIVRVDLKTGQVLVRPVAAETPAGHSLELWYIGEDKTPRSMGVVAPEAAHLTLPDGPRTTAATFAVTVEPRGGSQGHGPSGPVVYAGQLIKE